ncbi:glycosyltransferase [Viscerimonas tarda]
MKLSIITVNYNNAAGLEKTIRSIVSQDYDDFEYLVIDGASTDGSVDILENGELSTIPFRWISEPDTGIYNAMNKGIRAAKGDYLLFINSGDTLYNEHVLSDAFKLAKGDTNLIYGDLHRSFPDGHTDVVEMPDTVTLFRMIYSTLTHPTTFIKKELFDKYGLYREDLKIVSDWAFFLKLMLLGNVTQQHIPLIVATFEMDGISSQNEQAVRTERKKALDDMLSLDLQRILYNFDRYERFYNKPAFAASRRIRSFIQNFFSLRSWKEYVYKKRFRPAIWCFNKTVREQKRNPMSIPVIIINYNRLSDLKKMLAFFGKRGHTRVVIVDNNSTYPPLLNYYEEIKDQVSIERLNENKGHLAFWKDKDVYNRYSKGYYILTDPDIIPNENLPTDYMEQLVAILDKNKHKTKVGFALNLDDIPDTFSQKQKVIDWEKQFWKKSLGGNLYDAILDTTFAIYPPRYLYNSGNFLNAIRVAGNFTAQHGGWYVDGKNLTDEELFYYKTSNTSNSWKLNAEGELISNQ